MHIPLTEINELETIEGLQQISEIDKDQVKEFFEGLIPDLIDFGLKILFALLIYIIGRRVIKIIRKIVRRTLERSEVEQGVMQFIDSCTKVGLNFLLIVIIGTQFGVTTASVIALLGSAGLAIGLAMQGSLENFAGGVLILTLKPFRVGDYIIEDGHKNEGTVTEIQIFYTKLLTLDNRVVTIPNGSLANSSMTNVTAKDRRFIDLKVGISYESDIKKAKQILTELVERESRRLEEEPMQVFVSSLEDSCVKLGLRFWVKTEEYWNVRWDMIEQIKLQFDENGIEIPYNQLDIRIRSEQERKETL